jgi:hypothetical protein
MSVRLSLRLCISVCVHARAYVTRLQLVPQAAVREVLISFFVPNDENDDLHDYGYDVEGQWYCI